MRINIDEARFDNHRYFYGDEPFTGEAVETNPVGQVIALTTVRDGIPHGPEIEWYPSGQVESERTFLCIGWRDQVHQLAHRAV